MTKRPKMTPENYKAVYDYYGEPNIKPWINTPLRVIGEKVFQPDLLMTDETKALIREQFALGKGALLVCNHPSAFDIVTLPGATRKTGIDELQETAAMVKDSLYRGPMRILSEATGSIPLFRPSTYKDPSMRTLIGKATHDGLSTATERLKNEKSVVFMVEGTRSSIESRTNLGLDVIKDGVATTAQDAGDVSSFILPVGIHYRENARGKIKPRNAVVAFGSPILEYADKKQGIKKQIHAGINEALARAVAHLQALDQQ